MGMVDYIKMRNILTEKLQEIKAQIDSAATVLSGGGTGSVCEKSAVWFRKVQQYQ